MDRPTLIGTEPEGDAPPVSGPEHEWKSHGSLRSRVIDTDPVFQKRTTYWYDSNTREQFLVEDWYGVDAVAEATQALRRQTDERARLTPLRDDGEVSWTHVFTIPVAYMPDFLAKTNKGKNRKAVNEWFRDPVHRTFLTRHFRIGI